MNPLGLIFVATGLFVFAGGLYNWNWFMNSRKVRFLCLILTRTGARIVYILLGLFIAVIGVLATANLITLSK